MAGVPVFLDTLAFVALLNGDDAWHEEAVLVNQKLHRHQDSLITTDWILAEFLSWCSRPPLRSVAGQFVTLLQQSARVIIEPASRDNWHAGFQLYQAREDKSWSLVDCISINCCNQNNIQQVFTADHHFEQAGLQILLRKPN